MNHVSDEDRARVGELLKRDLEDAREQLAKGFVSKLHFEAIDTAATGPVRATAEECVQDCVKALKDLLGQLGIDPGGGARVIVARVETLT